MAIYYRYFGTPVSPIFKSQIFKKKDGNPGYGVHVRKSVGSEVTTLTISTGRMTCLSASLSSS
jgi:hypothetical protein